MFIANKTDFLFSWRVLSGAMAMRCDAMVGLGWGDFCIGVANFLPSLAFPSLCHSVPAKGGRQADKARQQTNQESWHPSARAASRMK